MSGPRSRQGLRASGPPLHKVPALETIRPPTDYRGMSELLHATSSQIANALTNHIVVRTIWPSKLILQVHAGRCLAAPSGKTNKVRLTEAIWEYIRSSGRWVCVN